MANKVCIPKEQETALKAAIAKGDFSLEKIKTTKSSSERFELVNKYLENEELSKKVVREIEKRLSSKKETIVEDYINRTFTDIPENTRKGVFNKFKRMSPLLGAKEEKDFLEELVAHKFGAYITKEEANQFEKLTNEAIVLKEKIPTDATDITPESRAYGEKLVELENAEGKILLERTMFNKEDFKKFKGQKGGEAVANWSKYLLEGGAEAAGATRSFLATADISALFRQLWKIFSSGLVESAFTLGSKNDKLKVWSNALKTTMNAVSQTAKYGDERVYDAIRAEIHAHPNSYNGVFDAAQNSYGLRAGVEEQFPSSIPSEAYRKYVSKKANIFKISEVAYNSAVLKARFDLANLTIDTLKKGKVNIMDKKYADPAGEFVSAFTGRGGLGPLEGGAVLFNKIFFAPKFAASQFSPYYQILKGFTTGADNPAARLAMKENIEFIVGTFALMSAAVAVRGWVTGEDPDYRATIDPKSNNFGKVLFPGTDTTIDFTGGNRSVVGLFTAMATKKYYDARLGVMREKNMFQLSDGKPVVDFVTAKFAPVPALIRDLMRKEQFGGKEMDAMGVVKRLLMPITLGNVLQEGLTKDDMSTAMLVLLAEGVGFGTADIRFKPQNDEWKALLNTDEKAYWKAVDELWTNVHTKVKTLREDEKFQALPEDKQAEKLEKIYRMELDKIIHQDKYQEVSKEKLKEIKEERKEGK